jgi:hypothetical protein
MTDHLPPSSYLVRLHCGGCRFSCKIDQKVATFDKSISYISFQ